jgi:GTP cyclohydrolase II
MFQLPEISSEARAAARLASGQPIWLSHAGHYYWVAAADGARPNSLPGMGGKLFITAERARALGAIIDTPLAALRLPSDANVLEALINPLKISQSEILQDFDLAPVNADHPATYAMVLIRQSGVLPALIMGAQKGLPPADAIIYETAQPPTIHLEKISAAALPLQAAPNARVESYRDHNGRTHLAIIVGQPRFDDTPLVRIHSSCLTGDVLGSLRCDCGDQLQAALAAMHLNQDGGVLLYLDQEGRGIGLANKLRAYQLQDQGMDTYAANQMLGFADDERDFIIAGALLQKLSISTVRLMTNNPHKIAQLTAAGIMVKERVPILTHANTHNQGYLATKRHKGGHMIRPLASMASPKKI